MSHHSSRAGQRADTYTISDYPHTRYFECGVPVMRTAGNKNVSGIIAKKITFKTLCCPNCGETGYYDDDEEAFCEDCGLELSDPSAFKTDKGDRVISDAKTSGRIEGSDQ